MFIEFGRLRGQGVIILHYKLYQIIRSKLPFFSVVHSHRCWTIWAIVLFEPEKRLYKYSLNKSGVNS